MSRFTELLASEKTIVLDGAMGTQLQKRGLPPRTRSDLMNISSPETVTEVHRLYIDAGSDIINANTFGANAHALAGSGASVRDVIAAGIAAAKAAAGKTALVALDLGPVGELLEPNGGVSHEDAYALFAEQAKLGAEFGADLVAIETMSDLDETCLAIRAVRENTALDVAVTMTFGKGGRTYLGVTPTQFAEAAEALGAAALGLNCSYPPEFMLDTVEELRSATTLPLIVKLNAGLPGADGGYDAKPEDFAQSMLAYRDLGVQLVGACCGSDERFIAALKATYK